MKDRNFFEKRRGPKHRAHNQPTSNLVGAIKAVLSVTGGPEDKVTHAAIRIDVDFLAVPIMVHVTTVEELDDLIDCLISARNSVWPNN